VIGTRRYGATCSDGRKRIESLRKVPSILGDRFPTVVG
jgi:hypothetical protein